MVGMSEKRIAKIAVAAANYSIDKPYDYLIPDSMADVVAPGMRVTVPFRAEIAAARALSSLSAITANMKA